MNDGIKILLERIKTHPEEFIIDNENPFSDSKWRKIIQTYKSCLPKEDVEALDNEINKLLQEKFTSAIMEELLDPKSEQLELDLNLLKTPRMRMQQAGQTLGVFTSSTSVKELLAEKTEKQKPHKTIFGKLFNYT